MIIKLSPTNHVKSNSDKKLVSNFILFKSAFKMSIKIGEKNKLGCFVIFVNTQLLDRSSNLNLYCRSIWTHETWTHSREVLFAVLLYLSSRMLSFNSKIAARNIKYARNSQISIFFYYHSCHITTHLSTVTSVKIGTLLIKR